MPGGMHCIPCGGASPCRMSPSPFLLYWCALPLTLHPSSVLGIVAFSTVSPASPPPPCPLPLPSLPAVRPLMPLPFLCHFLVLPPLARPPASPCPPPPPPFKER